MCEELYCFWEIYLFICYFYHLFVTVCALFWIMDSDRSPVSVLDNMDANLDCVLDDDLTSTMPTTSTPTDLTPTTTATAGERIQRCQCGRRMSSLTHDYHSC